MAPIDELRAALIKQLSDAPEQFPVEVCSRIIDYVATTLVPAGTNRRLFQHMALYQYVFTKEQEQEQLKVSKTLQFPDFPLLNLKDARTLESIQQEEEEERLRIANIDNFPSDMDIFESLSPTEVKKVTYETILAMVESIQAETEKNLQEQRNKIAALKLKE
ncbi:hypothetical protein HDU91_002403 [Kappamyces sp. JEL0680]|nr:hypothetical protein HDU91_002403 [Kappamyces sp. JEL0680]